ncbi:MAG TPA: sigma-70 family RNA polymerase sigma factor [Gemmataceae bacterium]|nr:sigma-70 family RNA polymerase sigma factor [Gemmataceae bacterium]
MVDWAQLVHEHGPLVWQTVYRLVGHGPDAADCFQNTFVAALQLARREAVLHWPALLKRLATTQALDCLRRRTRETDRRQRLAEEASRRRVLTPEQTMEQADLSEGVRRALSEIEPRQAEVFCLACLDGWSYVEIGARMGITVNHVGVLLSRARAALRERLHAFDPAERDKPKTGEQP